MSPIVLRIVIEPLMVPGTLCSAMYDCCLRSPHKPCHGLNANGNRFAGDVSNPQVLPSQSSPTAGSSRLKIVTKTFTDIALPIIWRSCLSVTLAVDACSMN